MNELAILSFDTQAAAEQARKTLQQVAGDSVIVLPDLDTAIARATQPPAETAGGLRAWALLSWRVGSRALGGVLTVVTWTSLIVGGGTGFDWVWLGLVSWPTSPGGPAPSDAGALPATRASISIIIIGGAVRATLTAPPTRMASNRRRCESPLASEFSTTVLTSTTVVRGTNDRRFYP